MRASRGPAIVILLFAASAIADRPAGAEPHLVIVASGTGTLPVDKITEALRAELPDLVFTIANVADPREGVASARLVRWADGRVAVGFRDQWGREDVRVVEPGPEPAVAIAHAFAALRASLVREPFYEPEPENEDVEPPEPEPPTSPARVEQGASPQRPTAATRPAARVAVELGFGHGSLTGLGAEATPNPFGSLGLELRIFPGRMQGAQGPLSWVGVIFGGQLRGSGLGYANRQLDAGLALEVPLDVIWTDHWLGLRGGWRVLVQDVASDSSSAEGTIIYEGFLTGADLSFLVSPDTVISGGVDLHAVGGDARGRLGADPGDGGGTASGTGVGVRVGCRPRMGIPVDWSFELQLMRYALDLGANEAVDTSLRAVLGIGYRTAEGL